MSEIDDLEPIEQSTGGKLGLGWQKMSKAKRRNALALRGKSQRSEDFRSQAPVTLPVIRWLQRPDP